MRNSLMARLEGLRFNGIEDLYKRRDEIRLEYRELELWEKEIYKWYFFYELSLIRNSGIKSALWEYMNEIEIIDLEGLWKSFMGKME